jgi:hypothetical protein
MAPVIPLKIYPGLQGYCPVRSFGVFSMKALQALATELFFFDGVHPGLQFLY